MSELRERRAALERRFLRPDRAPLEPEIVNEPSGPTTWARAIALGRLPSSFTDDPARRFRASMAQRVGELVIRRKHEGDLAEPLPSLAPVPCDRQAARLLCSDPAGLLEAETHARALLDALLEFGVDARPRVIAWRIAGNALERPEAGGPPLGQRLRGRVAWLRELMQRLTGRSLEHPHAHARFEHVRELLEWSHRRARALDLRVPTDLGSLAGRALGELPDPFTPWLRVIETGYWVWGLTRDTIELAAPFPAPEQVRLDKRGRPDIKRRSGPRAVWSTSLEQLRLACMRGDVRSYVSLRRACAEPREPGSAPLIHYGVFGGSALLDAMLADDPQLDVHACDDEGRTPLMIAAGWLRAGPLASRESERAVPLGRALGAETCRWLLAHCARIEAVDQRGWTALHWACHEGRAEVVPLLVSRGAALEACDRIGRTPLLVALSRKYARELDQRSIIDVIDTLLELGADADARDEQGWTGLHYLADGAEVGGRREETEVARLLRQHGAQPSRDRLGRSPAAILSDTGRHDPAFDPRTPVAAGPGAWPPSVHASEQEQALTEHPDRLPRDALAVWVDWLQSRGELRGELLAAHLQLATLGRKRRRSAGHALARVQLERVPLGDRILRIAFDGWEPSPGRLASLHARVVRRLGVIVRVDLHPRSEADLAALGALLEHEALVSDLRLRLDPMPLAGLLVALTTRAPMPSVRRLVLASLPAESPTLDRLALAFPRVRELRLIGRSKLDGLSLAWPDLEILRIRHGDTSEWTRGGSHLELELPNLRELDLALPVGARTSEHELDGCRRILAQLGRSLERLRLSPVDVATMASLLAHPPFGLRTLVLDRVRGQALELLAERLVAAVPHWLAGLDDLELGITAQVVGQREVELATLHARLPNLRVRIR